MAIIKPEYFPDWATLDAVLPESENINKIRPNANLRQYGYDKGQIPSIEEFNWQLNNVALWIRYNFEEVIPNLGNTYMQRNLNLLDVKSPLESKKNILLGAVNVDGTESTKTGAGSIALGDKANANLGIALGKNTVATNGVSVGLQAQSSNNSTSLGDSTASTTNSVAVGKGAVAINNSVSVGNESDSDTNSVTLGYNSSSKNLGVSVGYNSQSNDGVSIGANTNSTRKSIAIGDGIDVRADNGIVIGNEAKAGNTSGTIGNGSIAIGYQADTKNTTNSVTLGYQSINSRNNEFSVGNSSVKRTIANVANATLPTDAVTLQQLEQAKSDLNLNVYPVGCPIPYPLSRAPAGFIKANGQEFNVLTYTELAKVYPNGFVPDLRAEFIRGVDDGRGVDANRQVLTAQGDAIRNITGKIGSFDDHSHRPSGAFYPQALGGEGYEGNSVYGFVSTMDASLVVPTANENRPRNVAFMYIIRAI